MNFFSHAKINEQGVREGSKALKNHTFGVQGKALEQFYPALSFPISSELLHQLLDDVCRLHDLGKYSSHFQCYLLGQPHDSNLKQHARFGAFVIYQKYLTQAELAYIGYYLIKNHHRSLHHPPDVDEDKYLSRGEIEDYHQVFEQQKASMMAHLEQIELELGLNELSAWLSPPNNHKQMVRWIQDWTLRNPEPSKYFLLNYLFSLLIEADKLDASDTLPYPQSAIAADAVSQYIGQFTAADNQQNRLRNRVRAEVLRHLDDPDILDNRLFLLTAPTGIGKTLTALDFALRLRAKLPHRAQIITGLPFINIIEQTLQIYQDVLQPHGARVVGHYQYADVFGGKQEDIDDENMLEPSSENNKGLSYDHLRMMTDTWQGDVIVTSFVQLLQTLLTNKNKLLLKFNHFAGAIVIMDEVQSLRLEQVPLIGAVLYCMSKYLNTRFILMTATKPLIFELADQEILKPKLNCSAVSEVKWLLSDPEPVFRAFERTQIVPLLDPVLGEISEFVRLFSEKWQATKSALIVVNTVNRSIELFQFLEIWMKQNGHKNPCYYLSTNIIPAHRLGIIQQIKADIKEGLAPILVATQVVEAGVDLDFDLGFRDLGPIDSIVQVAGRINRENSPERAGAPLYIVDFEDCKKIYGPITAAQAKLALGNVAIPEPEYYRLVEQYFQNIADKSAYDESKRYFNGIMQLRYDGAKDDRDFKPVNTFRVIQENGQTVSVFVDWDEKASSAKAEFLALLAIRDKKERYQAKANFDQHFKKDFHQHIIAVPAKYAEELPLISQNHPGVDIKYISPDNLETWYQTPTGFNRQRAAQLQKEENIATIL